MTPDMTAQLQTACFLQKKQMGGLSPIDAVLRTEGVAHGVEGCWVQSEDYVSPWGALLLYFQPMPVRLLPADATAESRAVLVLDTCCAFLSIQPAEAQILSIGYRGDRKSTVPVSLRDVFQFDAWYDLGYSLALQFALRSRRKRA